jgi:glutamate/tyrosine decarboxylase-like PLP-dependent enzyme
MRAAGYRAVDMLVKHFTELPNKPVTRKGKRADLEAVLREALPEQGADPLETLDLLEREVFSRIMHLDHPRFFAFVPSPGNFLGALADALASGFNVFAGTWLEASGPAMVELVTIDWLREACGLPPAAGGLFVSGGSMANLTALALARHVRLGGPDPTAMVYCSEQTHSSIARGLNVLGFKPGQLRTLPVDAGFRLDLTALRQAVAADRQNGRLPFCVVANAGTTNTGAIDPLPELADYCDQAGLWLHVDGAYGAAAVLCARGRALLAGLGRADSLSIDPHKWLFQPYEIGCLLVREEAWLKQAFHILPEYLTDTEEGRGEVNFCDRGIQLTRGFRALKLWLSLKTFGKAGYEAALERGFELAEFAAESIAQRPDWQVTTPAQMGVLTFRYAPPQASEADRDRINASLVDALIRDSYAMLSTTRLNEQTVLRMCTINPRTRHSDILETVERLDRMGRQLQEH